MIELIDCLTGPKRRPEDLYTLQPGRIIRGSRWSRWSFRILEHIGGGKLEHQRSIQFKAEVIPNDDRDASDKAPPPPQWAVIKIGRRNQWYNSKMTPMKSERLFYGLKSICEAQCFRKSYELISYGTLALEWMDTTLDRIPYKGYKKQFPLLLAVLKTLLQSCVVLDGLQHVHTDINPTHIYVSNYNSNNPIVKLGSLGNVHPTGSNPPGEVTTRAPETHFYEFCTSASQLWSVGATLLSWINPFLLNYARCPTPEMIPALCMSKLKRLFPEWYIPDPGQLELNNVVKVDLDCIAPFETQLTSLGVPREITDVLALMMIIDPKKRPSAKEVLESREMRKLERFVEEQREVGSDALHPLVLD
ncbi:hypothetical protein BO94DRAFT_470166 [Aspergillus sclerotioniger CBS 115572]|uniref:Protein kinase domain-containing protein n=1 Tax=Aspergillus sclerotioniger CBS 115572 TaxID=1450535 RepID=A0A317WBT8_9EURO|nr:hypothetical protein BO94DRAFT_470166 [Aspergillus sclerotioniger CBS 115572]PWY81600.1 hypothetical protein BO94DRAFT_470166 [Aspergillus sclerotioniger CBS 115572]